MTTLKSPYQDKLDLGSSHLLLKAYLDNLHEGSRVLDIGIGGGTIGRICSKKGLRFFGVEPNPGWAQAAEHDYCDIYMGTLEETPDSFLSNYDVVLFSDVLEHMVDPLSALKRLVHLQGTKTVFLISVPNIANIWIRFNLFFGRFEYKKQGILDHTHLRFFTKRSLISMINSADLKIVELIPTPIPLGNVNTIFLKNKPGFTIYRFLYWMTLKLPTLFGYQFFCKAIKQDE